MLNGTVVSSSSSASVQPTTASSTTSQVSTISRISTVSTTSLPTPTGSAVPFLPPGWDAYGCWIDGLPAGRTLVHELDMANNTIQNCVAHCILGGYTIAGLEYGYVLEYSSQVDFYHEWLHHHNFCLLLILHLVVIAFNVSVILPFIMGLVLRLSHQIVSFYLASMILALFLCQIVLDKSLRMLP